MDYCTHAGTRTVITSPPSRHYARLECADCGTFLRFLPRPENVERRCQNGIKLARLTIQPGLTPQEREFITNVARYGGKLSPKQQVAFDQICARHLVADCASTPTT